MKGLDVDDCGKPLDVSCQLDAGRPFSTAHQGVFLDSVVLLHHRPDQRIYTVNENIAGDSPVFSSTGAESN
jgi:hypothetical protein